MRLLQRLDFHRHILEGEMLALEIEHLLGEALQHDLDCFRVDLLRGRRIGAVIFEFDRHRAAAEADLQPAAAHLIEHADFLDQPQRVVQRHRPDQRAEPKPAGALRDRRQEHARRRRHAERRRMMLGEMVGVEPGTVVGFRDLEAVFVELGERSAGPVEMIEDAEFHLVLSGRRWNVGRPGSPRSASSATPSPSVCAGAGRACAGAMR